MKRKLFDTSFYIAKRDIPYTLVIIDVQEGYVAAENETLLDNIIKEIKTAREDDAAILFVNMDHIGRNIGCIWDAAYDYTYFAQVIKRDNDGSDAIIRAFRTHKFLNKTNLRVGGIYTHLCLTETVNGLTEKLPKYNYIEIRKQLIEGGWKFKTQSDTEVVLAAYQRYGTECVKHFVGMWSLAIYDKKNKRLFELNF